MIRHRPALISVAPAYLARGETLVFLVILIVTTALLVGWLFLELAPLTIGDMRLPRVHQHPVQDAAGAARSISSVEVGSAEVIPTGPAESERAGRQPPTDDEERLYDAAEAEQAVRERLYGQRGRRA